jgi:hypothetical protein
VEDLVATRAINRAGTGVGLRCDVGRLGQEGSLGDIGGSFEAMNYKVDVRLTLYHLDLACSPTCHLDLLFPDRVISHLSDDKTTSGRRTDRDPLLLPRTPTLFHCPLARQKHD